MSTAHGLIHHHDLWLVLIAGLLCAVAAITVFAILDHLRSGDRRRGRWVALAGLVSGIGIWATHFVAMLAYDPGVTLRYDPLLTALSVLAGILLSMAGWWLAVRPRPAPAVVAGSMIAAAIGSMHYLGMAALRLDGDIAWHPGLVLASLVAALALSIASVTQFRRAAGIIPWRPAACLVAAICTAHFLGMGAMTVHAAGDLGSNGALVDRSGLASLVIAGSVLLVAVGFFVLLYGRILDREKAAARIAHLAYHDALTGLPNRLSLGQALEAAIAEQRPLAVICVDLDGFKAVNDTHGHGTGDALLEAVSTRLRKAVRDGDLVARTGGDEFIIVQLGGQLPGDARNTADRLIASMARPFLIDGLDIRIGASAGIAIFPQDADTAKELTLRADAALYCAKRAGRGMARCHEGPLETGPSLTSVPGEIACVHRPSRGARKSA